MKRVFTDCSEEQMILICNVLDQYCVKYKVITNRTSGFFCSSVCYDIEVDLDREKIIKWKDGTESTPDEFILDKVSKVLSIVNGYNLEECDLPGRLRQELYQRENKNRNKNRCKNHHDQKRNNRRSNKEYLDQPFNNDEAKQVKDMFDKFFSDIGSNLMEMPSRKGFISGKELDKELKKAEKQGRVLKFEDLPEDLKHILLKKYPIRVLKSKRCKFIADEEGISVVITPQED